MEPTHSIRFLQFIMLTINVLVLRIPTSHVVYRRHADTIVYINPTMVPTRSASMMPDVIFAHLLP